MEALNKNIYTHKYNGVNLTQRQHEILTFIREYRNKNGYAPAIRDIVDAFGMIGTNAAMCHLKTLRSKGLLEWTPDIARTFRPTDYEFVDVPSALAAEVREFVRRRLKEIQESS